LVKKVGDSYFWTYPGTLLLDVPEQTVLSAYSYYDILIFNEMMHGDLTFMGWNEDAHIMESVSIYAQLGLPPVFDLGNHISDYLEEFPDYEE